LPLQRTPGGTFNILEVAELKAAFDTATYYERKLLTANVVDNPLKLLTRACSLAQADGLWLEFGVASGGTIRHIAKIHHGQIYGFDSFQGLPENWRYGFVKGAFEMKPPAVPDNVELVKGLFSETLPLFVRKHPGEVSFIHIDCDLYSSTKTIFSYLERQLTRGTIIVFDEYWNYPGWRNHEYKAFSEFVAKTGFKYRYDSFVPFNQQVCVVLE
jgi:hypothetical protein